MEASASMESHAVPMEVSKESPWKRHGSPMDVLKEICMDSLYFHGRTMEESASMEDPWNSHGSPHGRLPGISASTNAHCKSNESPHETITEAPWKSRWKKSFPWNSHGVHIEVPIEESAFMEVPWNSHRSPQGRKGLLP